MDKLFKIAFEAAQKGQSYAFATVISSTKKGTPQKTGAKMIVLNDGSLFGTIGGGRNEKAAKEACLDALAHGLKPYIVTYDFFGGEGQSVCGGQIQVFIEPFIGTKKLIICGAGHIALPLSVFAKILNFEVTIIDTRREFAHKNRFPHVDNIILTKSFSEELTQINYNHNTSIMILTQGNELDYECLKAVADKPIKYLGVIASKAKRIKFLKKLNLVKNLKKIDIRMPAGLDIGAQTPEEIAISILAEIVSYYQKSTLGTAKFKDREIVV